MREELRNKLVDDPFNSKGEDISNIIRGRIQMIEELLRIPPVLKKLIDEKAGASEPISSNREMTVDERIAASEGSSDSLREKGSSYDQ